MGKKLQEFEMKIKNYNSLSQKKIKEKVLIQKKSFCKSKQDKKKY